MNINTKNFIKGGQIREDMDTELFTPFPAAIFKKKNPHSAL